MNHPAVSELGIWLLPAEPARSELAERIRELARQYDAPVFDPHITLYSGASEPFDAEAVLERVIAGLPALRVRTRGTAQTPQLFKTAFVQFERSPALNELAARAQSALPFKSDYTFDPHLSLIYKRLPEAVRADIARGYEPPAEIACEAVCVVVPGAGGWEDVASWQRLATRQLAGAERPHTESRS